MVLAVNDQTLTRVYSALVTAHFYQRTIWGSLGSRNYEAALQNAYSVLIQTETYGTAVADRTRAELHSGFVQPTTPSTAAQHLFMSESVETAQDIPMLDRLEGVLGSMLFDRAAMEASTKMATHVDNYFGGLITGINYATEDETILGDNTNFINRTTAKPATEAAAELVIDACQELVVWAKRKELDGIQIGGPSLSDLYLIMAPEIAAITSRTLLKYGMGSISEVRGLVREGIMRFDATMIGRVFGVDLYSATQFERPVGADTNWDLYGGVRQGVEYAARPLNTRRVSAQTREAGGWKDTMGSMMQYGGKVVNSGLIHHFEIDGGN